MFSSLSHSPKSLPRAEGMPPIDDCGLERAGPGGMLGSMSHTCGFEPHYQEHCIFDTQVSGHDQKKEGKKKRGKEKGMDIEIVCGRVVIVDQEKDRGCASTFVGATMLPLDSPFPPHTPAVRGLSLRSGRGPSCSGVTCEALPPPVTIPCQNAEDSRQSLLQTFFFEIRGEQGAGKRCLSCTNKVRTSCQWAD